MYYVYIFIIWSSNLKWTRVTKWNFKMVLEITHIILSWNFFANILQNTDVIILISFIYFKLCD